MTTPTLSNPPRLVGSEAQRLAADAATAAELRAHQTDPDVVALRVERFRTQVDRLMWAGIVLGLCFTMTSVQQFAAAGAAADSLAWWSAWLLDPMVSLVLLAVLRAEQVTTRYQVLTGTWPRVAKWLLLTGTYVMNTWTFWAASSPAGVVLHSVPPLVVVLAAEAVTDVQHALTECVHRAHTAAHRANRVARPVGPTEVALASVKAARAGTANEPFLSASGDHPSDAGGRHSVDALGERGLGPAGERPAYRSVNPAVRTTEQVMRTGGERRRTPAKRSRRPVRRKLLADYVREARAAWTPEVVVSPAWVRQATDCSRGLSSKVAATLSAELARTHHSSTRTESEGRAA